MKECNCCGLVLQEDQFYPSYAKCKHCVQDQRRQREAYQSMIAFNRLVSWPPPTVES